MKLLTVKQVASILDVSPSHVRVMLKEERILPSFKDDRGIWRISSPFRTIGPLRKPMPWRYSVTKGSYRFTV